LPAGFFVPANEAFKSLGFLPIRGMLRGSNGLKSLKTRDNLQKSTQFCAFRGVKGLYLIVTNFLPLIVVRDGS